MVKQVENNKLEKEYGTTMGRIMQLRLTHTEVEEWKQNGNFKHLKKELENIPNIEFSCSKTQTHCIYTFKTHSSELTSRLSSLIKEMLDNKKVRLMKAKREKKYGHYSWRGEKSTCPLW